MSFYEIHSTPGPGLGAWPQVPQATQDALLQQMMNIERLYPDLMARFSDVNIVAPSPGTEDWPTIRSTERPMSLRTQFSFADDPSEWNTVAHNWVRPSADRSLDQWRVDIDGLHRPFSPGVKFTPQPIGPDEAMRRFRSGASNALAQRMMEHAGAVSSGNPGGYFEEMYNRHWGSPNDAVYLNPGDMAADLADDAIEITGPSDREYASRFYDQDEFRNQMRASGRALNQMKSEGFRGSANLRSAAGMAGLPLALLGPRLGLPTPVARAAGGALTGGSLFGVPGAIVGGGLGLLASQVDDKSLLGQVLGSMV